MDEKIFFLNYFFNGILLFASIYSPLVDLIMILIYIFEGRFSNYLPTVSETSTEYLNNIISFLQFSLVSISSTFSFIIISIYMFSRYTISKFTKNIIIFIIIITLFFYNSIPVYPCNTMPIQHYVATLTGFICVIIFQFIVTFITMKGNDTSKFKSFRRLVYSIGMLLSLILTSISSRMIRTRINVTMSTLGEYMIAILFCLFILSFYHDVKHLRIGIKFDN